MTTDQALGLLLPHNERLDARSLVLLAQVAEGAGYDTISTGEVAAFDAIALLTAVGVATRSSSLMTGVIPMGTRSVALAAMGLATLASIAPGRAVAGVGASSREVVSGWHRRPYGRPVSETEAYIGALRRVLNGGPPRAEQARPGDFRLAAPTADIPVVLAAINPRMLAAAGRYADGVYLALCTAEDAATKVGLVRKSAIAAGRDPDKLRIYASIYCHVGDRAARMPRLKRDLLGYATLPTHRAGFARAFAHMDEIEAAWARGDRAGALELIDDEGVEQLVALGDAERVVERIGEYRAAGVDIPVLLPVSRERGDLADLMRTVVEVGVVARGLASEKS